MYYMYITAPLLSHVVISHLVSPSSVGEWWGWLCAGATQQGNQKLCEGEKIVLHFNVIKFVRFELRLMN